MDDISNYANFLSTRLNNLSLKIDELDEFVNNEDENTSYTLDGEETSLADGLAGYRADLKNIQQQLENMETGGAEDGPAVRQGLERQIATLEEDVDQNYQNSIKQ